MMMSPESYYMGLTGKTAEEILTELNGLRQEISELKAALRSRDLTEPDIMPSRDVRLAMALDYFDMAKRRFWRQAASMYRLRTRKERSISMLGSTD